MMKWLRKDNAFMIILGLAPLFRSGAMNIAGSHLGVDRITRVRPPFQGITFDYEHGEWERQVGLQNFPNRRLAKMVSCYKLFGLHLMQVVFFLVPFGIYSGFMGLVQWSFATVVAVKEAWYFVLIVRGTRINPSFLLFPPFNETDYRKVIQYGLMPDMFIVQCISGRPLDLRNRRNIDVSTGITIALTFLSGISAWLAMVVGLSGRGAMFPTLLLGYLTAGGAPLVFPFVFVQGRLCECNSVLILYLGILIIFGLVLYAMSPTIAYIFAFLCICVFVFN